MFELGHWVFRFFIEMGGMEKESWQRNSRGKTREGSPESCISASRQ